VDIRLNDGPQMLAEGTSEVNAPLHWNELSFFNTQVSTDPAGQLFAGIQIVKDPGRPIVFAGMLITSIGGLLAFARRKVWS
jgi:cytochrome c biogenesis protein ResB